MTTETSTEALEDLLAEKKSTEVALAEISALSCSPPSDLSQYQDRFANGLPGNFAPEVTEFFDGRNRLSHWFPRLDTVDIPTPETEILELQDSGGQQFLKDEGLEPEEIVATENPETVLKYFGHPDFEAIEAFVKNTPSEEAFLRGDYKSATFLGDANHIQENSKPEIIRRVIQQLQDRIITEMRPHTPLILREHLDLDFYPDSHYTLHPEVRFFIADGEVLYHFPRVEKRAFARATDGVAHYKRVINAIDDNVDQLYEWAHRAAQQFSDGSWSLDFVMDTNGDWVATDMAINGFYYSTEKGRWHSLSEHKGGSPYNLEEQLGTAFPEPDVPEETGAR